MTISVVVPTCNRLQNLRLMLAALARQTVQTFEVIIADDGSNGGRIISSGDQLWTINAHGDKRLLLPSLEWVRRLGYKSEEILNDPNQEIIAQSIPCGEAVEIQ